MHEIPHYVTHPHPAADPKTNFVFDEEIFLEHVTPTEGTDGTVIDIRVRGPSAIFSTVRRCRLRLRQTRSTRHRCEQPDDFGAVCAAAGRSGGAHPARAGDRLRNGDGLDSNIQCTMDKWSVHNEDSCFTKKDCVPSGFSLSQYSVKSRVSNGTDGLQNRGNYNGTHDTVYIDEEQAWDDDANPSVGGGGASTGRRECRRTITFSGEVRAPKMPAGLYNVKVLSRTSVIRSVRTSPGRA